MRVRCRRKLIRISVLALAVSAVLSTPVAAKSEPTLPDPVGGPPTAGPESVPTSQFTTGATLTQYSLDPWGDPAAVAAGRQLLATSTVNVAQHIHGFGGVFAVAEDGTEDWSALDRRFAALDGIETVVLTACCAPAHMEQAVNGEEPGNYVPYLRPRPDQYQAYADFVLRVVQRYPAITHVQVWNEMKGFWNVQLGRWDYEAYTDFYNTVWNTVKGARPDIQIGGPYVVLNSYGSSPWFISSVAGPWGAYDQRDLDVINYWMLRKEGADFIAVDGKTFNRDGVELVDPFAAAAKFAAFTDWLRSLDPLVYPDADTLPIWWSELYANPTSAQAGQTEKNAVMSNAWIELVRSGAATALMWGPQGDQVGDSFPLGLFTDTRQVGGGQPTLFHATQQFFNEHVEPETVLQEPTVDNPNLNVLQTAGGRIVVNTTASIQQAVIDGEPHLLTPFQVSIRRFPLDAGGAVGGGTR